MQAITTHLLPLGFRLPQAEREVAGGYFVWLGLPGSLTATALSKRCQVEDVIIAPGTIFEVPGDQEAAAFNGHIRLCFAWEGEEQLSEGVERVSLVARRMLRDASSGGVEAQESDHVHDTGDYK